MRLQYAVSVLADVEVDMGDSPGLEGGMDREKPYTVDTLEVGEDSQVGKRQAVAGVVQRVKPCLVERSLRWAEAAAGG